MVFENEYNDNSLPTKTRFWGGNWSPNLEDHFFTFQPNFGDKNKKWKAPKFSQI